ncbi:MAG: class I SAM-dependent methyltransferase [Candidatus Omnitrophota bacterium]|jgi:2-polyprenyl-3-methyl-5-hydroxy-6-metoxy-1,4-benzoquinol methylase
MKTTNYKSRKVTEKYSKYPLVAVYVFYPALLKLAGNVKDKNILDIGCGSGWFSNQLYKKGAKVLALDNSFSWINVCKTQNRESSRLQFILTDCDDLKVVKNARFDIVFANMLFPSIASRRTVEKTFAEIGRVIKKAGSLFLAIFTRWRF